MQLCSRDSDSSCSRAGSCCGSLAALLMSAMVLSSRVRAADSSARSRYSRSLQGHDSVALHKLLIQFLLVHRCASLACASRWLVGEHVMRPKAFRKAHLLVSR